MMEFLINYWFAVLPTTLTGVVLLGKLKKLHDEKTRTEEAHALAAARRKHQG